MKKKLLVLALGLGLSLAMLAGCGPATTESLVDGMFDSKMESATINTTVDIAASIDMDGASVDATAKGDLELQLCGLQEDAKEKAFYVNGEVSAKVGPEFDESLPIESYMVTKDDTTTVYNYNKDADTWYYSEQDDDSESALDAETINDIKEAYKKVLYDAELAKETEDIDGEKCYVLTLNTTADTFGDVFDVIADATDESADVDSLKDYLKYVNVNMTLYVSKANGNCVSVVVDMSETDVMGMFDEAGVDPSVAFGADVSGITFDSFKIEVTVSDVDKTEVEVPDDVVDDAVESDSISLGDLSGSTGAVVEATEEPSEEPIEATEEPSEDPTEEPSTIGANADGSATLYDYSDEVLLDVNPLSGYVLNEDYTSYTSIYFENASDEYNLYNVACIAPYELDAYVIDGESDFGDEYSDYVCDVTQLDNVMDGSVEVYCAHENYLYSDYEYDTYYIFIPYVDGFGDDELITVELPERDGGWTVDEMNDAAATIFGE